MGKSRVAPLKSISIPRLELTAATVGAKLSKFLVEEMDCDKLTLHFWTDSMTVLRYLRNVSTRFKIFVAHRVQQIQDTTDVHAWNYVPTEQNPADLASRGIQPNDAQRLQFWLKGPAFLQENSAYTRLFEEPSSQDADLEIRAAFASEVAVDLGVLIDHYSSLPRLQRAVVWLMKLASHVRGESVSKDITVDEMKRALLSMIRYVQRQAFRDECVCLSKNQPIAASSKLKRFTPIMRDGVLCVGGRIDQADIEDPHPIILSRHTLTELLIRDVHERNAHAGSNQVLTILRRKYYVVRGYSEVQRVLNTCVPCKRHHAKPAEQLMASLPRERVDVGKNHHSHTQESITSVP